MSLARPRQEFLWVLMAQGLGLLLNVGMLKVLTWQLGAAEYGRFALGLSLAGVLNLLIYGPLVQGVSRYFHLAAGEGGLAVFDGLVGTVLRRVAVGGGICAILLLALSHEYFGPLISADWRLPALLALGYGLASGTLSVILADFNTRRARRAYALLQSADGLLRLVAAAALAAWLAATADWALAGFLAGSVTILLLAWRVRQHRLAMPREPGMDGSCASSPVDAQGLMRRFIGYTLPFSAFAIPSSLVCYGDRWVLQHSLTAADVGIYVAIAQIASAPANLLLAVFSYTLNPFLFQQAGDARCAEALQRSRQLLYRGVLLLVVVLAGVILVSVLLDTWIVRLLTSAEFVPYARLLWLLVLAAALFQIAQALTSEAYVHDRPWSMMAPKLIHAALFVVLAVAWVGPHQLMGVALAAVISAAVYLWLVVAANRRARYGNMHRAAGGLR